MVRRSLAVAIALAALATPAYAMRLAWTDRAGDANFTGHREVPGSQRAFDIVGARLNPTGNGIVVQVDLVGRPSEVPGAAVWFMARQGGCTILAQWVRTPDDVPVRAHALTACLGERPYTTPIDASTQDRAVRIEVPDTAMPGTPRHVTLRDIAVGTSYADPVTGVAQVAASVDVSCYHGIYVPAVPSRSMGRNIELPSLCDARSSVS
jgi:hypothetical protein